METKVLYFSFNKSGLQLNDIPEFSSLLGKIKHRTNRHFFSSENFMLKVTQIDILHGNIRMFLLTPINNNV